MKKTLSRALSLLLVLVMVIGVMPAALAAEPEEVTTTISGAPTDPVQVGTAVTLNVDRPAAATGDYTNANGWTWTVNGAAQSGTNGSLTISVTEAMAGTTVSVSVSGTYTSSDETKPALNVTGSTSFSVAAATPAYTVNVEPASVTLAPSDSTELTATVKDASGATISGAAITWSTSNEAVAVVASGVVTARDDAADGQTAKITATYTPAGGSPVTGECLVTIKANAAAYSVIVEPSTLKLPAGKTEELTATVKNGTETVADAEVAWSIELGTGSDGIEVTTAGTVIATPDAKGTATVTATYTPAEGEPVSATCAVEITAGEIECANVSVEYSATSSSYALKPTYAGKTDSVDWRFSKISGEPTSAVSSLGLVSVRNADVVGVQINAYEKGTTITSSTKPLATKVVYVSFYNWVPTIKVTMDKDLSVLNFDDKNDINATSSLAAQMRKDMLLGDTGYEFFNFSYTDVSARVGKLEGFSVGTKYVSTMNLGNMTFTVTGGAGGTWAFDYTVTMSRPDLENGDVILGRGSVEIKFDAVGNTITYETDNTTKVTFSEADFYKLWQASGHDEKLSYVQFGVSTYIPLYGDLYTTKTGTTKVTSAQKFAYGTYSGTGYLDLGSVTYAPDKAITQATSVSIPFTAYGDNSDKVTGLDTISGAVVIKLNELTNEITSRGTTFGTYTSADEDYADQIAEAYKEATNANLGYVIFDLPSAQNGKLYKSIPSSGGKSYVAQAEQLARNTKLYYTTTGTELKLYQAAFVPAAGVSGKVTLTYTAYGTTTADPAYEGSISFTVVTKTKSGYFSDITAKSYSWAADSVDFLYNEGVAQGSNNKYNPSANITRGDFMLMLYRAFLEKDYGTYNVTSNFPDVVKGTSDYSRETYQAVGVGKYLGIAQGTNDRFNPKANITRQEAMVLIYRTLDVLNKDLDYTSSVRASSFKDYSKISSWATTAITNLVSHGVIVGTNDCINPQNNITRAEMACILHRVITY